MRKKKDTIITDYSCIMSLLNIAGDDSSVVSKGRSFQQVMAEGKKECLKEFVWYRGRVS